jgi:hypothetical protein
MTQAIEEAFQTVAGQHQLEILAMFPSEGK